MVIRARYFYSPRLKKYHLSYGPYKTEIVVLYRPQLWYLRNCLPELAILILIMFFWVKRPCRFVQANVAEKHAVSTFSPEDGFKKLLRNVGF